MTANEVIILIMFICVIVVVGTFLTVFLIEHFGDHSVYGRHQVKVIIREDSIKGSEIVLIKEATKRKKNGQPEENKEIVVGAKELLAALEVLGAKEESKPAPSVESMASKKPAEPEKVANPAKPAKPAAKPAQPAESKNK